MSRIQNLTAIVLQKRDYLEKDLILVVLDNEGFRRELLLKGGGRLNSKRRRHVERMNLIEGTLYKGTQHDYLQDVSARQSFTHLKDDFDRIRQASLLLELCELTLLDEDPHPEIFQVLSQTLEHLNNKNVQNHLVDASLIQVAHHLGFLPSFKECGHCHHEAEQLHWDRHQGTLHCHNCRPHAAPLELKYRKALEFFRHASLNAVAHLKLNEEEQERLRSLSLELVESQLSRPLRSLSLGN